MQQINIANVILKKRREKGLTQDALADFIGVTKASVSKWETGQSYPDITLLPQLAAFFNISLDELIGYAPQMSRDQIRKLYKSLSADFAQKPFEDVLTHVLHLAKQYYACFPLLFQLGVLLVNNSAQSGSGEQTMAVIEKAKGLFVRVKEESGDPELSRFALNMEAFCALTLGNAQEVIALLENSGNIILSQESLLAPAYRMLGRMDEARSVMQAGIYQHMGMLFDMLGAYLELCIDAPEQFAETCRRGFAIAETFDLKTLHPGILAKFYVLAAQGYSMLGDTNHALSILETYTALVTGDIYPLKLQGDGYFTLLAEWIETLDLGSTMPRDEKVVRRSMVESVAKNPAFAPLADREDYRQIVQRLEGLLERGAL